MCDVGRLVRATKAIARVNTAARRQSVHVWMLIGLAAGTVVCVGGGGLRHEARQRTMSDAAALGYRVGLGEDPVTL